MFPPGVLTLEMPEAVQAGSQGFYARCRNSGCSKAQVANARHLRRLLGTRSDWRSEDATDEPDKLSPLHSDSPNLSPTRSGYQGPRHSAEPIAATQNLRAARV
jgi:hypothetical protein